jgi:iron-sulfur cluster assembly protein
MSETVSSTPQTPPPAPKPVVKFGITDAAVARLQLLLKERGTPDAGLRVAVKGGGCSGLTYTLEWAEKGRERDKVAERDGVRVFIDPKSYLYLMGTELDFTETMMSSGFKLNNPNVKSACGCGESFTI